MARSDLRKSTRFGIIQKFPEFHSSVAHYIGIGSPTQPVSLHKIFNYLLAVLLYKIHNLEIDPQVFSARAAVQNILVPRAISKYVDAFLVHPSFHIGGRHVVALLF